MHNILKATILFMLVMPSNASADWATNARPGGEAALVLLMVGFPFFLIFNAVSASAKEHGKIGCGNSAMTYLGIPIGCWLGTVYATAKAPTELWMLVELVGVSSSIWAPRCFLWLVSRLEPSTTNVENGE